ncbi:MAG: RDD family protein [Pirellulales bacterium]
MPKAPRQLDARIEIVTPENIAFHYVLAGPFRRLPAYLIDVALRLAVLATIGIIVALSGYAGLGGLGFGVFLVSWFILSWFYGGMFEALWNGQTPGKRWMGLRVLSIDGRPINAMQAVLRNILRDVDAWPMVGAGGPVGIPLFMVGLFTAAANDRYQRLGDLACGTIVVIENKTRLRGLAAVDQREVLAIAEQLPPSFVANSALAQTLSAYVARRDRFSHARRHELAGTLAEPLIERFNLPLDTNPDLLLVAMYYRAFIADRPRAATVVAPQPEAVLVETTSP